MKTKKAYQLLVLEDLDHLFTNESSYPILVAILHWLKDSVTKEHPEELRETELDVIKVIFMGGGYPALAIHYLDHDTSRDVAPLVEAAVARLVRGKTVADLIAYVARCDVNWAQAADEIMRDDSPGKEQG